MQPRCVQAGTTYLLTRRCVLRQFLLRPSKKTNEIVAYCLAAAAERTNVSLHAFCAMSNHIHTVLTDTEGRLPEFLQHFHRNVAVAMNAFLGRRENFWSSAQSSAVILGDEHDVLDKMAYVLANPTTAGLVRAPRMWPGVISGNLGESRQIHRPSGFFRSEGSMPQACSLAFEKPPQFADVGEKTVNERLAQAVARKVDSARKLATKRRKNFLGVKAVLKLPLTTTGIESEKATGKVPRFAIADSLKRSEALSRWRGFLLAYREARHQWIAGKRDVRFPHGTWLMRRCHRVNCGPPGLCAA